jgi:hypothetical protein
MFICAPVLLVAQEKKPELSVGHELSIIIASNFKIPQLTPPPPKPNYWK